MSAALTASNPLDEEGRELRKKIIEAASQLFEKKGLYETSVAEIAEVAGISVPVTYHYVKRKADIMLLIMENFTDRFKDMVLPRIEALTDPREKLIQAMEAFFTLVDQELVKVVLVYRKSRTLDTEGRAKVKAAEIQHVTIFKDIIEEGMRAGVFADRDADLAAYNILVAGHTWALKKWHFGRKFTLEEYLKHQTEFILAALRP